MPQGVLGVIPARYASSRFPGKPLAMIGDKPMIRHVYEQVSRCKALDAVVVATDDERIRECVLGFGGRVEMTSPDHPSGSDRIAEVARTHEAEFIINIQGDEPFIRPEAIEAALEKLRDTPAAVVGTLVKRFEASEDLAQPGTVKVVLRDDDRALYFSRSVIPFLRDLPEQADLHKAFPFWQHIGLYVFRRDFLFQFVSWPQGQLENAEKLEQLRILERGYDIVCARTDYESFCVDTPEDLRRAQEIWKERNRGR